MLNRYYMTREHGLKGAKGEINRAPMTALEDMVIAEVAPLLTASWLAEADRDQRAIHAIRSVRIFPTELLIDVSAAALGGEVEAANITVRCAVTFERPRNSTTLIRTDLLSHPRSIDP